MAILRHHELFQLQRGRRDGKVGTMSTMKDVQLKQQMRPMRLVRLAIKAPLQVEIDSCLLTSP